jgi:signal transduction histidine kinase
MDAQAKRHAAKWFVIGFAVGAADLVAFRLLGVTMRVGEHDATAPIVLFFAVNFGVMFAVIARLRAQRGELRELADVVRAQYDDLERTQGELAEARELAAIGRLSSGVAHEVRNPLGVIRASASMILEDLPGDARGDAREAATFIRDEVDRLDAFVRRLMDYTRPLQAERLPVDARALLERVAALARAHATDLLVSVEVVAPAEDLVVEGDEELLSRLLLGLTRNAVAAADREVTLSATRDEEGVRFEVRDDGEGVPHERLEEVFSPFYTTRVDGTGLGLAMARKIARAHGARVGFVTGRGLGMGGRGACARVTLPTEPREE